MRANRCEPRLPVATLAALVKLNERRFRASSNWTKMSVSLAASIRTTRRVGFRSEKLRPAPSITTKFVAFFKSLRMRYYFLQIRCLRPGLYQKIVTDRNSNVSDDAPSEVRRCQQEFLRFPDESADTILEWQQTKFYPSVPDRFCDRADGA